MNILRRLGWALVLAGVRLVGASGVQTAMAAQAEQTRRARAFEQICKVLGIPPESDETVAVYALMDHGLATHRRSLGADATRLSVT